MTKIDQIQAAANSAASVGLTFTQWMRADAQMNKLLTPVTLLKMCAVIKAANDVSNQGLAIQEDALAAALQELKND